MSRLSKAANELTENSKLRRDETVTNFMGGESYVINPLDTLKMVTASSIFGEPAYYRDGAKSGRYVCDRLIRSYSVIPDEYEGKTTEQVMELVIDAALEYDFKATLDWAVELRNTYNMRLNPQVIMVRAALHPNRPKFTEEHPGYFNDINTKVMGRADEPMSQMSYYLYRNKGKKNNVPSILKRSWKGRISKFKPYEIAKYKNHEIGLINAVRICHANNEHIDTLMKTGTFVAEEGKKTWENYRSEGMGWKEIFERCDMGHMALLRNLRGVFTEVEDRDFCKKYLEKMVSGVLNGKQFPFRYYSAIRAVKDSSCNHKPLIIDALNECLDISINNMPKLKGKTMCLSDNSGSAWGSFNSEYGTVTVAEIDNLSSVITAACSDEGYVGKFGDEIEVYPISKRNGVLDQSINISSNRYSTIGGATEGGIWKFFRDAIKNKEHWDNIFIYSDMQAGHGGLYGTYKDKEEYRGKFTCNNSMINVFALVQEYRKRVNPKVNVFSVQTAGYTNVVIPEYAYRTNIMYGWTGKESIFADAMINLWDQIESK